MLNERKKPIRDLLLPRNTSIRPSSIFDTSFTYDQAMKENSEAFQKPNVESVKPVIVPLEKPSSASMEESASVACIPCSRDHISTASSVLSEAMRFVREKDGIKHPEVRDRIGIALDELNAMERIDLAPSKTVTLKGREKEMADWILDNSRNIRHDITSIRSPEDLEKTAAATANFRSDFFSKFWDLLESLSDKKT